MISANGVYMVFFSGSFYLKSIALSNNEYTSNHAGLIKNAESFFPDSWSFYN